MDLTLFIIINFLLTSIKALSEDEHRIFSRIVKGKNARVGQFPYHAVVNCFKHFEIYLCGGVLISDSFVLTAARKFLKILYWIQRISKLTKISDCLVECRKTEISLGGIELSNFDESGKVSIEAKKFFIHHGFRNYKYNNDIALIKLPRKVNFTDQIKPVKLPSRNDKNFKDQLAFTSGFGAISDKGNSPEILQYTKMRVVKPEVCNLVYGRISKYLVCTKGVDILSSTCSGDSG